MRETFIKEGVQEVPANRDESVILHGMCHSSIAPSVNFQGSVVPSARACKTHHRAKGPPVVLGGDAMHEGSQVSQPVNVTPISHTSPAKASDRVPSEQLHHGSQTFSVRAVMISEYHHR